MKTIIQSGILKEQEEAFRRGFLDNGHGVKREACPFKERKERDLQAKWLKGWDKGEKGLQIRLPEAQS